MNNRLKKKAEKRKRERIHKLLDVVLDINGFEKRQQEKTGNLPTAFFEFSGHVYWVEVSAYKQGYRDYEHADISIITHANSPKEIDDAIKQMQNLKAESLSAKARRPQA